MPPSTTGTLALLTPDPHLGGAIAFATSVSGSLRGGTARVMLLAAQDGQVVYSDALNALPSPVSFRLGGSASRWLETGGPAVCEAVLFVSYPRKPSDFLATVMFDAAG